MGNAHWMPHLDAGRACIHVLRYDADALEELPDATVEEALAQAHQPGVAWIDIDGARDPALVDALGDAFGLHPWSSRTPRATNTAPSWTIWETISF
jgi:hypothetical protein